MFIVLILIQLVHGVYSWIDHTLFTDYDMINVRSCKIIPPDAENVSLSSQEVLLLGSEPSARYKTLLVAAMGR